MKSMQGGAGMAGMAGGMPNMAAMAAMAGSKKQREVYVGNLTLGLVSAQMLTELFNGALLPMWYVAGSMPQSAGTSRRGACPKPFSPKGFDSPQRAARAILF
jgi:hypothetical protein